MTTRAPLGNRFTDVLGSAPDPDLLRLVSDLDKLAQSAATPEYLASRIEHAAREHTLAAPRSQHGRASLLFPFRLGPVAIALALLMAVTGGAYSAGPLIDKVFSLDSGAGGVATKNLGKQVDVSRSIAGFTVTLNRLYADANRVILGYTVAGPPDRRVWNFSLGADEIVANGVVLQGHGQVADGPIAQPDAYLQWFDASALQGSPKSIRLHITFPWIEAMEQVGPVSASGDAPSMEFPPMPPVGSGGITTLAPVGQAKSPIRLIRVGGPISFDVSVPFIPGRTLDLHQVATAGGSSVALERIVVTPSETRLYLQGTGPDVIGTLSVDSWKSDPGSVMQSSWATSKGLTAVSYLAPLSDKHGEWTFVAKSAGGSKSTTPWAFRFVLP